MDTLFTKSELHQLMSGARGPDVEQAEGRFLAALRARDAVLALGHLLARAAAPLAGWSARRKATAELNALSDRDLADMGLTRGDIAYVASGAAARARAEAAAPARSSPGRLKVYAPSHTVAI